MPVWSLLFAGHEHILIASPIAEGRREVQQSPKTVSCASEKETEREGEEGEREQQIALANTTKYAQKWAVAVVAEVVAGLGVGSSRVDVSVGVEVRANHMEMDAAALGNLFRLWAWAIGLASLGLRLASCSSAFSVLIGLSPIN